MTGKCQTDVDAGLGCRAKYGQVYDHELPFPDHELLDPETSHRGCSEMQSLMNAWRIKSDKVCNQAACALC